MGECWAEARTRYAELYAPNETEWSENAVGRDQRERVQKIFFSTFNLLGEQIQIGLRAEGSGVNARSPKHLNDKKIPVALTTGILEFLEKLFFSSIFSE